MRSHSSGARLWSVSLNPPTPALFTSTSRRPNVLSTRVAAYSSWCSTVTSQGITSVLPPASTMARAVSSSEDFVRPSSTAVAPRAASLRAIAEPMPRPAPVTADTCPARGCLVSIPLVPPGTIVGSERGVGNIHILCSAHLNNNNKEEDEWEPACLRKERYL